MSKLIIFSLMVILYSCASATPNAQKARERLQAEHNMNYNSKAYFDDAIRKGNVSAYLLFEESYDGNIPFWEDKNIGQAIYFSAKNDKKDLFDALMKSKDATLEMKINALTSIVGVFDKREITGSELNCRENYIKALLADGARLKNPFSAAQVAINQCDETLSMILSVQPEGASAAARAVSAQITEEHKLNKMDSALLTAYMQQQVERTTAVIKKFLAAQCENKDVSACNAKDGLEKALVLYSEQAKAIANEQQKERDVVAANEKKRADEIAFQNSPAALEDKICHQQRNVQDVIDSIAYEKRIEKEVGVINKSKLYDLGQRKIVYEQILHDLENEYKSKYGKTYAKKKCPK